MEKDYPEEEFVSQKETRGTMIIDILIFSIAITILTAGFLYGLYHAKTVGKEIIGLFGSLLTIVALFGTKKIKENIKKIKNT